MQELEDIVYELSVNLDTVKDTQAYMKAITNHHNECMLRGSMGRGWSCPCCNDCFTDKIFVSIELFYFCCVVVAVITSTHSRIMWWTFIEMFVLTAVSMAQISFLRRTLEVRRIL